MVFDKPFSPACARNCEPIAKVLVFLLQRTETVLEIGSGTGQHAVYFGARLPHLVWQTSDLAENHEGIGQWIDEAARVQILQVGSAFWSCSTPASVGVTATT